MTRLRRSLRASVIDGACHAAMLGFGEIYFPAFALLLGASAAQVGLLTTVPMLIGAGAQLLAPRVAGRFGDKPVVVVCAVLQAATFAPIAALAVDGGGAYAALFACVAAYWALALGINPPWNAWMGRMIPARARSRFFGRRGAVIQAVLLVSILSGGLLLHASERSAWGAASGFVLVFGLAACSRLSSAAFLWRQHDPPASSAGRRPPLLAVVRGMRRHPYGRLIALLVLIMGSVNLSAAYFTPFMLQELRLSYAEFTMLNAAVLVARMASSSYWGEIARRYGNRRALQVAATLLVPLAGLWVVSDRFLYLLGLQLLAGFAWAGFELMMILNLFDATTDADRSEVLSLYTLLNGVAIVIASVLGGLVLSRLGSDGYAVIFLGSSLLRAAALIGLGSGVGGRRAGEHAFREVFVRVLTFRPGQGDADDPIVLQPARRRRRRRPWRRVA